MKNLGNMMKQAQAMQAKMAEMQAKLEQMTVEGAAGGGMVKVTLTGKGEMRGVAIDLPDRLKKSGARRPAGRRSRVQAVEAMMAEEMVTGGLQLPPGMKMPFWA